MDLKKTALVLIDLQKESKYGIYATSEVITNTQKILEACRSLDVPVIYTRQVNREDGVGLPYKEPLDSTGKPVFYRRDKEDVEIFDEIAPLENEIVIDKHRWSGFYETNLDLILRSLNIEHLLMGGFVTDGCLLTSVFDAFFRDYKISLVKDICSATSEGAHKSAVLMMANWVYGITIYNCEEAVKELHGEKSSAWTFSGPDQMKFTPDNLNEVYNKLNS